MNRIVTVSLVSSAALLAFFGWKLTARAAYESAEYSVVDSDGKIEIRQYPDLMLAATSIPTKSRSNNNGFMRLFRYISGANSEKQKIAMTTPVFMEEADSQGQKQGMMGFVIPKDVAASNAPQPSSDEVQLRKRRGGRFAVIRFAGRLTDESRAKAEKELREWVKERGLKVTGAAESAGYDPPWTPGPLRRNEVLLRLSDE